MDAIFYNANEVFEMAIQIERNGEQFYAKAAESVQDTKAKNLLRQLRDMESEHQSVFKQLYQRWSDDTLQSFHFDPEGHLGLYLKAAADSHVFHQNLSIEQIFGSSPTLEKILETALRFEEDSVTFFLGMQSLIPDELGKTKIAHLILEEQGHIQFITQNLIPLVKKINGDRKT